MQPLKYLKKKISNDVGERVWHLIFQKQVREEYVQGDNNFGKETMYL